MGTIRLPVKLNSGTENELTVSEDTPVSKNFGFGVVIHTLAKNHAQAEVEGRKALDDYGRRMAGRRVGESIGQHRLRKKEEKKETSYKRKNDLLSTGDVCVILGIMFPVDVLKKIEPAKEKEGTLYWRPDQLPEIYLVVRRHIKSRLNNWWLEREKA